MEIYHNPRCNKSREALQLLESKVLNPKVIFYLNDKITFETLNNVIQKLGISPEELLRKNEDIYKTNFKGKDFSDEEWVQIMVDNPKLIERPIIIDGDKAVIGRPIERVIEFLK